MKVDATPASGKKKKSSPIFKRLLLALVICGSLIGAGVWGYQVYGPFLPVKQNEHFKEQLLIPTHPDLIPQTSVQTKAMPLEEARKIREPITAYPDQKLRNYYYAVPLEIQEQNLQPDGAISDAPGQIRDVVIAADFRKVGSIKLEDNYDQLLKVITPLRSFNPDGDGDQIDLQISREDLKRIPTSIKYSITSEITRNGSLLYYKGIWFDPSLYSVLPPSDTIIRTVSPEKPEFYAVHFNCPQICTAEELRQIFEKYNFTAIESFDGGVGRERFFENAVYTTENQLQQAVKEGRVSWYQRYDSSHWWVTAPWLLVQAIEPKYLDEYKEKYVRFPIQIALYLPDTHSDAEKEAEFQRIEQLVRDYGGRTYQEKEAADPGSFWVGVSYLFNYPGRENNLLIEKKLFQWTKPFEKFLFRKNIDDYVVADFPADKIWELMQDPNILHVNRANVVHPYQARDTHLL